MKCAGKITPLDDPAEEGGGAEDAQPLGGDSSRPPRNGPMGDLLNNRPLPREDLQDRRHPDEMVEEPQ